MVWLGVHTMTQTEGDATTGRVHSHMGSEGRLYSSKSTNGGKGLHPWLVGC